MTDAAVASLLWWLLGAVVLPVWMLSGLVDFLCHARTDIEGTSGWSESLLHLLQIGTIGIPLSAFLFLAPNASTMALAIAGVVLHTLASAVDLRYTDGRRRITPLEQYAHSFLNVLPWVALALVAVLHWPVIAAWFGPGSASDWAPRAREMPFDRRVVAAVLSASAILVLLPAARELHATWTARSRRQASSSRDRSLTNP